VRENIKISAKDPNIRIRCNLRNIRCGAIRHFRNEKKEYLKGRNDENKNKNIRKLYRGINEVKKGYQLGSNLMKDENGNLHGDSHSILNRWKNCFSQLSKAHNVSDVR
jgi:hypothetical protein